MSTAASTSLRAGQLRSSVSLGHSSDECAAFAGQYRLVARDDALAQGLEACPDCGAAEYLILGTVLAD